MPQSSIATRFLTSEALRFAVRVGLGGLFLVSGIGKLLAPYQFAAAVEAYGLVAGTAALLVAVIVPWLETVFGAALLLGIYPRASAAVITLLMLVFIGVMALTWGKTLPAGCGCFPWEQGETTVGPAVLLRDLGLLLLSVYAVVFPSHRWALYPGR